MRAVTTIQVLGRDVSIKELTVAEIRQWLAEGWLSDIESSIDPVDVVLFDGWSIPELRRLTDLSVEEIDRATPSELEAVWEKAKGVNRIFFQMRDERLAKAGEVLAGSQP